MNRWYINGDYAGAPSRACKIAGLSILIGVVTTLVLCAGSVVAAAISAMSLKNKHFKHKTCSVCVYIIISMYFKVAILF